MMNYLCQPPACRILELSPRRIPPARAGNERGPSDEHRDHRDSDHRHRHARRRAAGSVDVTRVASKWGDLVPHVEWDDDKQEEAWFTGEATSGRRRCAGDGRLARASAVSPAALRRHRPDRLGRDQACRVDGHVRGASHRSCTRTWPCSTPRASSAWATRHCSWRASRRTTTSSSTSATSSRADSSPSSGLPFWDLAATLAEIERCAANGHKGIVFTQDPSYFGLPQLTDRYWDPMWASARGEGPPGQLPHRLGRPGPLRRRSSRQRRPRQLRGDGRVVLHGQCPHPRPAHHRWHLPSLPGAELRLRRERHRLDPLRPRGARLAVAQLRRPQGAPGVRPAPERVLPPADLRLLLVRA